MTEEERKNHEENLNALKTVCDELGLEIVSIHGGDEDCNGWAEIKTYINNRSVRIIAYTTEGFGIRYKFDFITYKELKEELEKMIKQ